MRQWWRIGRKLALRRRRTARPTRQPRATCIHRRSRRRRRRSSDCCGRRRLQAAGDASRSARWQSGNYGHWTVPDGSTIAPLCARRRSPESVSWAFATDPSVRRHQRRHRWRSRNDRHRKTVSDAAAMDYRRSRRTVTRRTTDRNPVILKCEKWDHHRFRSIEYKFLKILTFFFLVQK